MSDAESRSEESEIESDTDSENDSGGSSKTETSMPERVGNHPARNTVGRTHGQVLVS